MIIYSKNSGSTDAAYGRIDTPIKMLIEHESDLMKTKGGVCEWLFNVENSNHFGESIFNQSGFDIFTKVSEGDPAVNDTIRETGYKFIEHLQFMKEFTITAEMMEDAQFGIAQDAKRRVQNFVRSYYNTINKACSQALANGTQNEMSFAGAYIDTTTFDAMPLFSSNHIYGVEELKQSNYFWGDIAKTGASDSRSYSIEKIEESLYTLAGALRSIKDEKGEPLGYVADTVILPCNKPTLEHMVKKVCGSENIVASANNDINIHYGNWNVIILPTWVAENDEIMVMSSEANKALAGNMFFNRVPLTVSNWIDHHTGNYNWTGRCRFGIGFGSYKHIVRAIDAVEGSEPDNCTYLYE